MKLLFVIDKPQTLQTVYALSVAASKMHHVTVFAYFDVSLFLPPAVTCQKFSGLSQMVEFAVNNAQQYDKIVAINHFNPGWNKLHTLNNCVSVEYCWNEIYNIHRQTRVMPGRLYANTDNSKKYIQSVLPAQDTKSLGSVWFETISSKKQTPKSEQITVLAPHTNFIAADGESKRQVIQLLNLIREYAKETQRKFILRDRRKFCNDLQSYVKFDDIVYDDTPFSHISLYAESEAVIHFCSSAVCELAFTETASVSLFGDVHRKLHQSNSLKPAVDYVNRCFFTNNVGDGAHATNIERNALEKPSSIITQIDNAITAPKNWQRYQKEQFPGDHANASNNILNDLAAT